jgi:hypothetical protein
LEKELKLDPDSNPDPELITDQDSDPNLQIVSDPPDPDSDAQHCYKECVLKYNYHAFFLLYDLSQVQGYQVLFAPVSFVPEVFPLVTIWLHIHGSKKCKKNLPTGIGKTLFYEGNSFRVDRLHSVRVTGGCLRVNMLNGSTQ